MAPELPARERRAAGETQVRYLYTTNQLNQ